MTQAYFSNILNQFNIKLFFSTLVLLFLPNIMILNAQTHPPVGTPFVTFITDSNALVRLSFMTYLNKPDVWIETSDNEFIYVEGTINWNPYEYYQVNGDKLRLHGHIWGLKCNSENDNGPIKRISFSENSDISILECYKNQLVEIDVTGLPSLEQLDCGLNKIEHLNIEGLTNLNRIYCDNNLFSTLELDKLYCQLSDRNNSFFGELYVLNNDNDSNYLLVIATNSKNANQKNWKVLRIYDKSEIPHTGDYNCYSSIVEATKENLIHTYPNPFANSFNIESEYLIQFIEIYDIYGKLVYRDNAKSKSNIFIETQNLSNGTYYLKVIGEKQTTGIKIVKVDSHFAR